MASIKDGNSWVMNQGLNPLVNFNFMLRVEGVMDLPCRRVQAFTRELEYDYIQEGGLNDYVHMRRKGITRPFTLEIERYVGVDYIDPLPLGTELVLPVILLISRVQNDFGHPFRTFTFTGCSVIKKTFGELNAESSGLLLETTTIAYREMLLVNTPWNDNQSVVSQHEEQPNSPQNRKDATANELKAMAEEWRARAEIANEKAQEEYEEAAAVSLQAELGKVADALNKALKKGGKLFEALEAAKKGLFYHEDDSTGSVKKKTLKKVAEELAEDTQRKATAMKESEKTYLAAHDKHELAQQNAAAARSEAEAAAEKKTALEQEKSTLNDRKNELALQLADAHSRAQAAEERVKAAEEEMETLKARRASETDNQTPQEPGAAVQKISRESSQLRRQLKDAKKDLQSEKDRQIELRAQSSELEIQSSELEASLREAGEVCDGANVAVEEAQEKALAAEEACKVPEEEYRKAQTTYEEAQKAYIAMRAAAQRADAALAAAQIGFDVGMRNLRPLQNSLINMSARMKNAKEGQTQSAAQYRLCADENNKTQALPEEPVSAVKSSYELVKKYANNTLFQERRVHEVYRHLQTAQELLDTTPDLSENPQA